ncbi:MAG: LysR family transcriptional regulator [Nannocystaceae bacterium]
MARLDDMRVFLQLAERGSVSGAARALGMTKQTVSRRLVALEQALGVQLALRTTRTVRLTDIGRAYAARCAEVVRLADEANRAASSQLEVASGTLRVTADHSFGEAFLPALVVAYLKAHPGMRVSVLLTARKVDLLDEGVDVAFRVGPPPDVRSLTATRLGPARLWMVASPAYLDARGVPTTLAELARHECLAALPAHVPPGWPLAVRGELRRVDIAARLRVNGLSMARQAALAGAGIAQLPEFAVVDDVAAGRLVRVLKPLTPEVGGVHLIYPHSQLLAPKVRAFVALARRHFGAASGQRRRRAASR